MAVTTFPPISPRRTTERAARAVHLWRASRLLLDADSGQTGTLTRTATEAPTDINGVARTVVHSQPAWEYIVARSRVAKRLFTNASLGWPVPLKPQAMAGIVDFVEDGGVSVVGGGVWYLGIDAATGGRIWIESSGTVYQLKYTDGTTTRTVTFVAAPTAGQLVRIRWSLTGAGVAQAWQSINGGAEATPGAAAALTLPSTWGSSSPTLRLNSVGTANQGDNLYLGTATLLGAPTLAQLATLLA